MIFFDTISCALATRRPLYTCHWANPKKLIWTQQRQTHRWIFIIILLWWRIKIKIPFPSSRIRPWKEQQKFLLTESIFISIFIAYSRRWRIRSILNCYIMLLVLINMKMDVIVESQSHLLSIISIINRWPSLMFKTFIDQVFIVIPFDISLRFFFRFVSSEHEKSQKKRLTCLSIVNKFSFPYNVHEISWKYPVLFMNVHFIKTPLVARIRFFMGMFHTTFRLMEMYVKSNLLNAAIVATATVDSSRNQCMKSKEKLFKAESFLMFRYTIQ